MNSIAAALALAGGGALSRMTPDALRKRLRVVLGSEAAIQVERELAGNGDVDVALAATLQVARHLQASPALSLTATGSLASLGEFVGVVLMSLGTEGSLSVERIMTGAIALALGTTAAIRVERLLSATPAIALTAAGTLAPIVSLDADAQAWIDAMSIAPNSTYEGAYDTFIKELKTGPTNGTNVWTKLDVLHVLAAHDSQAALLNAKGPTGTATAVNTPTFNAGQGFTFDGSTNYLNTNWYAAKSGNNFVQNSGHFGLYHRSIGTSGSLRTSGAYAGNSTQFFQMNTSNNVAASINSNALLSDTGNTAGWTLMNRTAFNDGRLYYGATEAASYNSSSSALSSAAGKEFFIGALNLSGSASQHGDVEVSVFTAGAGLTANEVVDLNAAIDNLKTAIGF